MTELEKPSSGSHYSRSSLEQTQVERSRSTPPVSPHKQLTDKIASRIGKGCLAQMQSQEGLANHKQHKFSKLSVGQRLRNITESALGKLESFGRALAHAGLAVFKHLSYTAPSKGGIDQDLPNELNMILKYTSTKLTDEEEEGLKNDPEVLVVDPRGFTKAAEEEKKEGKAFYFRFDQKAVEKLAKDLGMQRSKAKTFAKDPQNRQVVVAALQTKERVTKEDIKKTINSWKGEDGKKFKKDLNEVGQLRETKEEEEQQKLNKMQENIDSLLGMQEKEEPYQSIKILGKDVRVYKGKTGEEMVEDGCAVFVWGDRAEKLYIDIEDLINIFPRDELNRILPNDLGKNTKEIFLKILLPCTTLNSLYEITDSLKWLEQAMNNSNVRNRTFLNFDRLRKYNKLENEGVIENIQNYFIEKTESIFNTERLKEFEKEYNEQLGPVNDPYQELQERKEEEKIKPGGTEIFPRQVKMDYKRELYFESLGPVGYEGKAKDAYDLIIKKIKESPEGEKIPADRQSEAAQIALQASTQTFEGGPTYAVNSFMQSGIENNVAIVIFPHAGCRHVTTEVKDSKLNIRVELEFVLFEGESRQIIPGTEISYVRGHSIDLYTLEVTELPTEYKIGR